MVLTAFNDRTDAGQSLAQRLDRFIGETDVVVLGLPRGGVPVAFEIAKSLQAPLDAFVVGKLGIPGRPELALGAVTSKGIRVLNAESFQEAGLSEEAREEVVSRMIVELEGKEARYRQGRPLIPVEGRSVILVDDGAATGYSMRTALQALRSLNPKRVIAAIPIASREGLKTLQGLADEIECLHSPDPFYSISQAYADFRPVQDEDVIHCLEKARSWRWENDRETKDHQGHDFGKPLSISIQAGGVALQADLTFPPDSRALVLFAHGSGSSRYSTPNRQVARFLNQAGFATLLMDLLTQSEEAAALIAASSLPDFVGAVVSRGGRPDLAWYVLSKISTPTLLIAGGEDETVLEMNRLAIESMRCEKWLEVIPEATRLFEEPGTLEEAAHLAAEWFKRHLMVRA